MQQYQPSFQHDGSQQVPVENLNASSLNYSDTNSYTYKDTLTDVLKRQGKLTELLVEQNNKSTLPNHKIQPFSGDPLEFASFKRAFEFVIDKKASNDEERLFFLEQSTKGEANSLVKSCLHLGAEEGYREAQKLLQKNFGNEHKIAEAVMQRAYKWQEIKTEDSKALKEYAMFLKETEVMMKGLNFISELQHTSTIRVLSNKMPYLLRRKWRSKTDDIQKEQDRLVTFKDLVQFVEKEARILNNPSFGRIKDDKSDNKPQKHGKSAVKRSSFATNTQQLSKPCTHCEGDHTLEV